MLIETWQHIPYYINPIAFDFLGLSVRWYSLMYLLAILTVTGLLYYRAKKENKKDYADHIYDFFNYSVVGIIVGARLGYVLFYGLDYFVVHPLEIFWPFDSGQFVGISGLSFHGGAIGFIFGLYLVSKKHNLNFYKLLNYIIRFIPLGYTFGRLGNFLNLELFGRQTKSFIGMYFPTDTSHLLRYPSQLFEALGEGLLLYLILFYCHKILKKDDILAPIYIICYASIRFYLEFLREPDPFQNLLFGVFSYGQILSIVMLGVGVVLIPIFRKNA